MITDDYAKLLELDARRMRRKMINGLTGRIFGADDGVSLNSVAHPDTAPEPAPDQDLNEASLLTTEIDIMGVQVMTWVSVKDALPEYDQAVLLRRGRDNWVFPHTLADGTAREIWRWQAGWRYLNDCDSSKPPFDEWKEFGPGTLALNTVTHWAAITDPLEGDTN